MEKFEYLDEISEKCLILKIRQDFIDSYNGSIYEASRHIWRLSPKRVQNVDYVFSTLVGSGEIIEIFANLDWYNETDDRISFKGVKAPKSIRNKYIGKGIPLKYIKKGCGMTACRYINW